MSGVIAYKDRWLIEASYDMTLNEQKLMLACVGKLNPREPVPKEINISVGEFSYLFPEVANNASRELKNACDKLWDRDITIKDPSCKTKKFRWVQAYAEYEDGSVTLAFSDGVKEYLSQFTGHFAAITLENIKGLQNSYSIRLYEMCQQFIKAGNRMVTLEDFRFIMGVSDKYKDFKDLRKRVIDPAIAEVNDKTNLELTVAKLKKGGRSYTHLHFVFKEKEQLSLPI
ncbi:MAG: replication initiation protein [Colwellia sp.]|jgi:Protein involved in initiation of plasmid replication